MTETLAAKLGCYLSHRMPELEQARVISLERIYGGASRETYRAHVGFTRQGSAGEWRLILRRDPPSSLIETERATEYHAYRCFYGTAVPVPEPLWLEEDPRWLERPFFVMREIEGCESSLSALSTSPYTECGERIGQQQWRILGEIARADPEATGLSGHLKTVNPEQCWNRELEYWEGVIDADEISPQPIARAAIRWLRRNPPPAAQSVRVVHGDYRSGNFLYDDQGTIHGILDWEMCHLGDPLEDLAWSFNPLWSWPNVEKVGRLLPKEKAQAIWEEVSGLRADPEALSWWELFSSVKCLAIWISSARECADGKTQDPLLAVVGWYVHEVQERITLEMMEGRV
jgi:aminoglycoside phosphotransferase (APT) family kinase protein